MKNLFSKNKIIFLFFIILFFWQTEMILKAFAFIFSMLTPFLLAGAIAFIVNIPMAAIEKMLFNRKKSIKKVSHKVARPTSLLLSLVFLLSIIVFAVLVIVPQLSTTVKNLVVQIEAFMPKFIAYVTHLSNNNPEIANFFNSLDLAEMKNSFINFVRSGVVNLFSSTLGVTSSLVSVITQLFVAVIFAIYLLLSKERLFIQFKKVLYALSSDNRAKRVLKILSMTRRSFSRFITGQCVEGVILGILFLIVLSIFRIPFALLISIILGFSSLIPILGAFFGAGVGAFLILIEDPMQAFYFLIIFIVVQQIEGNLIYPKVVGDSIGLPAMWVLAAVSIGASLMGVVGILLCIPLASVAYALFRESVNKKLEEKKLFLNGADNG